MLGPDPSTMGFIKNLFWGRIREELIFPMPVESDEERARCDELLAKLDVYLESEHPTVEIDQTQNIPDWVITRLFDLGVMGMIAPQQYGGGGFGITSYNRVLARLGETCGSTAGVVSAHQSIGCGPSCSSGPKPKRPPSFLASAKTRFRPSASLNPMWDAMLEDKKHGLRRTRTVISSSVLAEKNGPPAEHCPASSP